MNAPPKHETITSPIRGLANFIWGLLSYLAMTLVIPILWLTPKTKEGLAQRLGLKPPPIPKKQAPRIWLHGASAGDIQALLPTALELKTQIPEVSLVGSAITKTGFDKLQASPDLFDSAFYLPLDIPFAVLRIIRRVQPDALVLESPELWPTLVRLSHENSVRTYLHNGRIKTEKIQSYRKLFWLTGNLFCYYHRFLMRSPSDADNLRAVGATNGAVHITGNTKFCPLAEIPPASTRAQLNIQNDTIILIGGSTHQKDEEILLDAFLQLRPTFPQLHLILAPRYLHRITETQENCEKRQLPFRVVASEQSPSEPKTKITIVNTMGTLLSYYSISDIAFVGGSFEPRGGHNPSEPALYGIPTLCGPDMRNNLDMISSLKNVGLKQVSSKSELLETLRLWLASPELRKKVGLAGRKIVELGRQTAAHNANLIATDLLQDQSRVG